MEENVHKNGGISFLTLAQKWLLSSGFDGIFNIFQFNDTFINCSELINIKSQDTLVEENQTQKYTKDLYIKKKPSMDKTNLESNIHGLINKANKYTKTNSKKIIKRIKKNIKRGINKSYYWLDDKLDKSKKIEVVDVLETKVQTQNNIITKIAKCEGHAGDVYQVVFIPSKNQIATSSLDSQIKVVKLIISRFGLHREYVSKH